MQMLLKGRIETIEQHSGKLMHIITVAAPDPYSKPSQYKVWAETQLGTAGSEVSISLDISSSCYKKSYTKDGIKKHFWEDRIFLNGKIASPQSVGKAS